MAIVLSFKHLTIPSMAHNGIQRKSTLSSTQEKISHTPLRQSKFHNTWAIFLLTKQEKINTNLRIRNVKEIFLFIIIHQHSLTVLVSERKSTLNNATFLKKKVFKELAFGWTKKHFEILNDDVIKSWFLISCTNFFKVLKLLQCWIMDFYNSFFLRRILSSWRIKLKFC